MADMILMPYNYLIDEEIRERTNLSFRNSIIIIDEAHNIASCSEESASFDITTVFLQSTMQELKQLKDRCQMNEQNASRTDRDDYYVVKKKQVVKCTGSDDDDEKKPKAEVSRKVKKWQFKSKYIDVERLYRLCCNFN